jgi:glutaminyl-peptide cyclotransferase
MTRPRLPALALTLAPVTLVVCAGAHQPAGFEGARAYDHVRQLVAIGPRVAGTTGAERARDYIAKQIQSFGLEVQPQAFEASTPLGPAKMVNLRVRLPAQPAASTGPRLIVAGHYDTKRFTEFAFVGANDGGSSAAVLIELARVLAARTARPFDIELLFLDGEEAVVEWRDTDNTYGSRYYVDAARKEGTLGGIAALVLVDMVGDRDLRLKRESNSTAWVTDAIWSAAKRLGRREFVDDFIALEDDHLRFLEAGVPAADIIDFEFPQWHTARDTLDVVSAESLQVVGDVVLEALPDVYKSALAQKRRR